MNKTVKYIFLPFCLTLLAAVSACTSDDTTIGTLSDYEAGEIKIDTLEGYQKNLFYGIKPGGHLTYDVSVDYIHPERLRYRWFLLRTYYNVYQAEQVGNVMKYPEGDTISYQKKLEWDITQSSGTYFVYLMAEDSITGMKTYYQPTTSYITLEQEGNQGGLYLLTERDGQTDIEIFTSSLMLIYGGDSCYYNYYSNLSGHYLEGKPRWIRGCSTGSRAKDGYLVATDKNLYRLNSVNMTQMNDWSTSFYDTPEVFDPQCAIYIQDNRCEFLINNGKMHVLYTDKTNDRKFSSPVAGDYDAYPALMLKTRNSYSSVSGAINAWQVIYDQKNHKFRPYYSKGTSISNFKTTVEDAYVDINNLPADPVAVFQTGGNHIAAIMNIDGKPMLYRYKIYNVVDKGNLSAQGARSIIDLSGCTDIQNAKLWGGNTSGYAFYYATDNAVYSFSPSTGQTTSQTVYTCEPGETVTAIYAWGSSGGGWPTSDCCLWIGVWDSNANEGKLIQYEMDVNYGVVNSMYGPMFGAPDNPVITRGWGKIVSMTNVDAE